MKKNFIYNIIYQILILILPLITVPYVSRILGADGIGIYSYTYSIVYYFMIIAMLGLNNYGNRSIAKVRDQKEKLSREFWSIYVFQLIMSIIMVILYLIYLWIFNKEYKLASYIQTIYIISAMFDINWFFFGIEKFKITITRNTIIKVLTLILIFIFVKNKGDVWIYTLILAGSTLFSNVILFSCLHKYIDFVKVNITDVMRHLKPNLILFLPVIAVSIYKIMDKIMLGFLSNISEVGLYENAEKIMQVPVAIISALGTVMLPRVSNMISNQKESEVKQLISRTMPFIMFITFPMILGLICISKDFSLIFFGEGFEKTGIIIKYLSITILFLSWGNVIRTQYLIPKEKDKEYIISAFIGAIINFIINCIFIPTYGAIGACIGTILAEFFVMFYQSWVIRKELPLKSYIVNSIGFLIKASIMFIIITFIGEYVKINTLYKMILQISVGVIIYVVLNIKYINNNFNIKKILEKMRNKRRLKVKTN